MVLGVYIVVLSISGSAVVFRRELNRWLVPRTVPSTEGVRLSGEDLLAVLRAFYPDQEIVAVREPARPERPVVVSLLDRDGRVDRLFDPYAAKDMGQSFPPILRAEEWLVDLHDNLLLGPDGRTVNGIGGILVLVLIGSGVVIWWPGRGRVWRSIVVGKPEASRRFARQLHNALGIWSLALLLVWAITAVYFAFPEPVERSIDFFDADPSDLERPGERAVLTLIQLHFGRFSGLPVRVTWTILGLVPAALFVSGFVMWWLRVLRRRRLPSTLGGAVALDVPGAGRADDAT